MKSAFYTVLLRVHRQPLHLQSDYAREFAAEVAALASLGFITTREAPQKWGRKWRVTATGLEFLRDEGLL